MSANGEAKSLRVNGGWSLGELARPVGVARSTIWRWERGASVPHGEAAIAWARILRQLQRSTAA